jgi:hypothetical protein
MSELMREILEDGALLISDICDIISAYMEPPNIINKFKQRMARARNVLEQGLLPVKDICDIILAFLAPFEKLEQNFEFFSML